MNVMIALARRCKICKRWALSNSRNYEIQEIGEIDDLAMDQMEVVEIKHCGQSAVGTHIGIKMGDKETQFSFLNTSDMPIGGVTYPTENVDLMNEGAKEQLALWKLGKDSLVEEYWLWLKNNNLLIKAINEVSQKEFEEAFVTTGVPYKRFLYKRSGIKVYQKFNADEQKRMFKAVAEAMITEIIWQMSAMEWPIEEWKKYGKTRILWPVLYMPISNHLIGMRVSAAARLGVHLNADGSDLLNKRIITLENTITKCNGHVTKLTDLLSQRQMEKAQLEVKLAEAYAANRQITEALVKAKAGLKTVQSAPSNKIEGLKSLIREMREQLRRYEKEEGREGPADLEEETSAIVPKNTSTSLPIGVKVGIIGGWRRVQTDRYSNVITSPGQEDAVAFERILKESGVLVVLTNHISHSTMWFVKSYAIEEDKPILYTTHLSIPIILDEAAILFHNHQRSMSKC